MGLSQLVDKTIDVLETELTWRGVVRADRELTKAEDCLARLPAKEESLRLVYDALVRLNAHESSRFATWDSKAIAMMGVVGLLIGLVSVAGTFLGQAKGAQDGLFSYCALSVFFVGAIGAAFLALWNAYMATRPRPFCTVSIDVVCNENAEQEGAEEVLRKLAAMEMAAYRNNSEIVDLKGTKALRSHRYFFFACVLMIAFVAAVVVAS